MHLRFRGLVAPALVALGVAACSPSAGSSSLANGTGEPGGKGQGGAHVGGGSSGHPGGDTGLLLDNGGGTGRGATGNDGPDGSCAALPFSAEHVITTKSIPVTTTETQPIDIFIMFDQSLSMTCAIPSGGDRWAAAVAAVKGFVQQPQAGVSVGINYFGNSGASSCDAATYESPAVEIGPLPQNAAAIVSSLDGHKPVSNTPTAAALSGAINHALPWKDSHLNDVVVVVLVTDGQPNACGKVSDVATVARVGWGAGAGVRTFVVGITSVGTSCGLDPNPPNVPDLDSVAAAGGTDKAIIIDATANPAQQMTDALNHIRQSITTTKTVTKTEIQRTKVACQFTIPEPPAGQTFDRDKVNIQFTDAAGAKRPVYKVASLAECAGTGDYAWYYDDPGAPAQILLCPTTCTQVQAESVGGDLSPDAGGGEPLVDVLLGCATKVAIR